MPPAPAPRGHAGAAQLPQPPRCPRRCRWPTRAGRDPRAAAAAGAGQAGGEAVAKPQTRRAGEARCQAGAKPSPTSADPTTPPAPPAAADVGFAVQLGAFGNAADAGKLRDRARAAGFSAFVEQVRTDKGVLNRVRVGPVASRAEADQLKAQVAAKLGVERHRPSASLTADLGQATA